MPPASPAHSDFQRAPLQRLWRTLDLTLTITFADAAHAIAAVRQIERVHARVHGKLKEDIGPFPRGTPYDANDPELLLWVHATLVDTRAARLRALRRAALRRRRVRNTMKSRRLLRGCSGLPTVLIPPDLHEFRAYMHRMVRGETLTVSQGSREIAASILRPRVTIALQPAFRFVNLFTIGLLPRAVRERYRLAWGKTGDFTAAALTTAARALLPLLPNLLRTLPRARP